MTVGQLRKALRGISADAVVVLRGATITNVHGDNKDCPNVVAGDWQWCKGHEETPVRDIRFPAEVGIRAGRVQFLSLLAGRSREHREVYVDTWAAVE